MRASGNDASCARVHDHVEQIGGSLEGGSLGKNVKPLRSSSPDRPRNEIPISPPKAICADMLVIRAAMQRRDVKCRSFVNSGAQDVILHV